MHIEFEWNPQTASINLSKHGIGFEEAMTVFSDPLVLSRLEEYHGEAEERWVTIGYSSGGKFLVVVHTHLELDYERCHSTDIGPPGNQTRASTVRGRPMKEEYDFSKAERGKFYRNGIVLVPPVHLEPEILSYLSPLAEARGVSLSALVNELLKKDIELIETVK